MLPDGKSPYADWFATLDAIAAAKVRVAVARMEQGNLSNVEWFRGIGEYKIDWGPGYRLYSHPVRVVEFPRAEERTTPAPDGATPP